MVQSCAVRVCGVCAAAPRSRRAAVGSLALARSPRSLASLSPRFAFVRRSRLALCRRRRTPTPEKLLIEPLTRTITGERRDGKGRYTNEM